MTIQELKPIIREGQHYNWGRIPGWKGYIKYDYYLDQLYFVNGDYKLSEQELIDKLGDRNDLFYII